MLIFAYSAVIYLEFGWDLTQEMQGIYKGYYQEEIKGKGCCLVLAAEIKLFQRNPNYSLWCFVEPCW